MSAHREPLWSRGGSALPRLALLAAILLLVAAVPLLLGRAPDLPAPDRRLLHEISKQAVEQPLHFLMAAAPVALSRSLAGVPWYGWAAAPLLVWREWAQWPSRRWWDPPLDWAFMALGAVFATWRRARPPQRPPSHPLRRKYAKRPPATASIRTSANG
jgi:hypothetical protein